MTEPDFVAQTAEPHFLRTAVEVDVPGPPPAHEAGAHEPVDWLPPSHGGKA